MLELIPWSLPDQFPAITHSLYLNNVSQTGAFCLFTAERPENRAALSGCEILAQFCLLLFLLCCKNIAEDQRNFLVNIVSLIHWEVTDSFMLFNWENTATTVHSRTLWWETVKGQGFVLISTPEPQRSCKNSLQYRKVILWVSTRDKCFSSCQLGRNSLAVGNLVYLAHEHHHLCV